MDIEGPAAGVGHVRSYLPGAVVASAAAEAGRAKRLSRAADVPRAREIRVVLRMEVETFDSRLFVTGEISGEERRLRSALIPREI